MRKLGMLFLFFLMMLGILGLSVQAEEEEEISYEDFATPAPAQTEAENNDAETEPEPTAAPNMLADGSIQVTITAVGDVTIGRNVQSGGTSIFDKELKKQNNDINFIFRNVKDIFSADDLTIANFEGVLADDYSIPSDKRENGYLFLAPTSYAQVLPANSVEAVTIENNHIVDFGADGVASTIQALEGVGVTWSNKGNMGVYETQGLRIAMLSYMTLDIDGAQRIRSIEEITGDIALAKETCDIVIVSFHWGNELDYSPRDNQIALGRGAIDAGADLVLGHHSHRINPIEYYKGRYIVYSLANCSFAGNNKPSDMFTFIFQTRFRLKDDQIIDNTFRIIPCRISSRKDYNDFAITPLTDQSNITTVLNTLTKKENTKNLEYAVTSYPMEWSN